MSTQRRENRWQAYKLHGKRRGFQSSGDSSSSLGWGVSGQSYPLSARSIRLCGCHGWNGPAGFPGTLSTPATKDLSPESQEQLATISLQSDYRIVQLVLHVLRLGSPPFRASFGAETGTPANHGLSPRHIGSLSGLARLHPTLTRVPAGRRRWAERYDGKGNMHLQHAA